jgi:hypothetical protein
MRFIRAFFFVGVLFIPSFVPVERVAWSEELHAASMLKVLYSKFGILGRGTDGNINLIPVKSFPGVIGTNFGWVIMIEPIPGNKLRTIREEFTLPEAPPTWGVQEKLGKLWVTPDRRTAVTEYPITSDKAVFANTWQFVPGDPIGAHSIRVYIDGALIGEYHFVIDKAKDEDQPKQYRSAKTERTA